MTPCTPPDPHTQRVDDFLAHLRFAMLAADGFQIRYVRPLVKVGLDAREEGVSRAVHGEGPVSVWTIYLTHCDNPEQLPVVEPPTAGEREEVKRQ